MKILFMLILRNTGGVRNENRLECYENIESQNIPFDLKI